MNNLKNFLQEKTGRKVLAIFGYEIGKYIDYSYVTENGYTKTATYIY